MVKVVVGGGEGMGRCGGDGVRFCEVLVVRWREVWVREAVEEVCRNEVS